MKKKMKTQTEVYQGMRRDWGQVNPVTKVIPNKKKAKRHPKHKGEKHNDGV